MKKLNVSRQYTIALILFALSIVIQAGFINCGGSGTDLGTMMSQATTQGVNSYSSYSNSTSSTSSTSTSNGINCVASTSFNDLRINNKYAFGIYYQMSGATAPVVYNVELVDPTTSDPRTNRNLNNALVNVMNTASFQCTLKQSSGSYICYNNHDSAAASHFQRYQVAVKITDTNGKFVCLTNSVYFDINVLN